MSPTSAPATHGWTPNLRPVPELEDVETLEDQIDTLSLLHIGVIGTFARREDVDAGFDGAAGESAHAGRCVLPQTDSSVEVARVDDLEGGSVLGRKRFHIVGFGVADRLNALKGEIPREAGQDQAGPIDRGFANDALESAGAGQQIQFEGAGMVGIKTLNGYRIALHEPS